jgi:CPA1 family monovalent cation:H+ antiporter
VLVAALVSLLVVLAIRPACVLINHVRLAAQESLRQSRRGRHPDRDAERQRRREEQLKRRVDEYNRRHPDHPRDMASGGPRQQQAMMPLKHDLVISWTGMRGVVTLAAAAGIPAVAAHGAPFPGRAEIQLIAFVIAVGTLLIQGPTLPPLIRRLDIHSDEDAAYESEQRKHAAEITQQATTEVITQAMSRIDTARQDGSRDDLDPAALAALSQQLQRFQANREALQQETEEAERTDLDQQRTDRWRLLSKLRLEMLTAQRRALTAERDAFRLDDDTYREMLEQLDYDEAAISVRMESRL